MDTNLIRAYAERLASGARSLKNLDCDTKDLADLREAVKYDIACLSLRWPHHASQAALERCAGKIDLFSLTWKDQPKAEKILSPDFKSRTKNGVLMHEHKTCVNDLMNEILASDCEVQTVIEILMRMELVWILRSEDQVLNKLMRSGRNGDHDKIYAEAGIVVVRNPALS